MRDRCERHERAHVNARDRVAARLAQLLGRLPPTVQRALAGGRPVVLDGQTLLPEMQLVLAALKLQRVPRFCDQSPVEGRRRMRREAVVYAGRLAPVAAARPLTVDGAAGPLEARHYVPLEVDARAPLLVYFHGGGFVLGDLDSHDAPCRLLCHEARAHVLSVAYRLAPEHKAPAAVEDALAAFGWACAHAASLGADPARVAVGGDSAGGNLAAVVSQAAASSGGLRPALQLLLYPALDRAHPYGSIDLFADGFLLTRADIDYFDAHYRGATGIAIDDPRVSPLCAPSLEGVAPALIVTAGFDPLRDEAEAYAARLEKAGVPTVLRRERGLIHGFANLIGVSPASQAALASAARRARALLERR